MTLRLTVFCSIITLFVSGCSDDPPVLTDTGTRDTGTGDTGRRDTGPRDTGTDGCIPGVLCMPTDQCQEGRTTCDPASCPATGPAPADTMCTGGTCDGLGTCVRTEDAEWLASDEAMFDAFGGAVAIDGDYVAIGVGSSTAGVFADAVYVWERDTGGNWAEQAILSTGDVSGGQFGVAVDIDGNTIVVGAPGASHSGAMNAGSVYVFERATDGTWSEAQRIRASDPVAGQRFGRSVAIDGGRIAIGAFTNGGITPDDWGKVYVFEADTGGTYLEVARLTASDGSVGDGLGWSVDIDGDRVVAGAPKDNGARGSVYLFLRGGTGTWAEAPGQPLFATEATGGDELGSEVLLRGATLIISAPLSAEMGLVNAGAVYVFDEQTDGSFNQSARLVASDGAAEDFFGAIALDGDTLLVGAPTYDRLTRRDMGNVYVFTRPGGGAFTQLENIYREAPEVNDRFGAAVAISGTTAIVGAPGVDLMTNEDSGAAYLFAPLPR